jgi:isoleucyl-tRNA synthetase
MLHQYHELPAADGEEALLARWAEIRAVRGEVAKVVEAVRTDGAIGSSLQAEVEIHAAGERFDALTSLADDLKFVLITSRATVKQVGTEAEQGIAVVPSEHKKCERCWHWRADVGANPEHPTLCARCDSNLHGDGEVRAHA